VALAIIVTIRGMAVSYLRPLGNKLRMRG
jgi:hypothetical protein